MLEAFELQQDNQYIVERIVGSKRNTKNNKMEYEVKWEGYGSQ